MAHPASNNVIPLADHQRAKSQLTRQESADVLSDCRDLALDRMGRALSGMLDRVEDDLFELAEKAIDRESQNVYLDARAQSREKRVAIEATFQRDFVEFFNRKVRGETVTSRASSPAEELSLVGHEDLEESLAIREMSRKIKEACEGELFALGQRMGFLLERPELEDDANPVSPSTVCAALKDACDQMEAGFKVRMALLHQFEGYAQADLLGIYHDLNSHLVARSILPEVRADVRRVANISPPERHAISSAANSATASDLFLTLLQLMPHQSAQGAPAVTPQTLLADVARMQREGSLPSAPPGVATGTSPAGASATPQAFLTELTRMHREGTSAITAGDEVLVNVVRNIKTAPQSATLSTVDAMTIDIVAMLFDYIFEDRHIPASVKAALGRLQIPTLKVALLDKSFFSSKSHPARRLIDILAESAIGLDESNARGGATLALIEQVVARVLAEFDTDLGLFESLVARVEAFVEEQKRAEADIVERSARLLAERERGEAARRSAEEEVTRRIEARGWAPQPVRDMLTDTWTRALARVLLSEGEGSPTWHSLLATMEDLLWSVEPKSVPDDRKRLVTMLPAMLKNLHDGMQKAGLPVAQQDVFFGVLVDCHATAVKAGLRGAALIPEQPQPRAPAPPAIEREVLPAGDLQVEEIRLKTPPGKRALRNLFTRTGIWTNLERGTWVEFARESGSAARARLTWISPNKAVYLFTNPLSASAAISISPEALAEQMRLGQARIIDDASLVDRAVGSMLANLRRAQG